MQIELARLRADCERLPEPDRAFAYSLLNQYDRRGSLSDKQWPWVIAQTVEP